MPDPEKIIDGLRKVERLKTVERQTLIGSRHESTSEHSFHAALIADMLAEVYPAGVDAQRVKDLVLYHDLVEVHAGDVALNDSDARETKEAAEHDAFKQLLTEIPNGERYKELYEEYEARETTEAVIAKKIDRLEVLVSAANEPAVALYRSLGFVQFRRLRVYRR